MALTLPIQAGRSYQTRDGAKATIWITNNRTQIPHDNEYVIAGTYECVSDLGHIYDKYETWRVDGRYQSTQDRRDLVDDWVDPIYKYTPIFLNGTIKGGFDSFDEAVEYAGSAGTAEFPLVGYLRINEATGVVSFAKIGEEFK